MPRPAALAPSTRAGAVDGQQRPALVAAGAELDVAKLGQAVGESLCEGDLGRVQGKLVECAWANPIVGDAHGPDRTTSRARATLSRFTASSGIVVAGVFLGVVFVA